MSTGPDDAAVITASLDRPQEFTLIFERHYDEIHRYLRRRHPEAAEELAAEVFMTAFDLRGRYRPEFESARPWLYGIASRLLARRRRTELRSLRAHARSGGRREPALDEYAEAIDRADAQRDSARVAAALAELKAPDRDALLLYALGGLSYEEVALALEVPVGTVRSRLARARKRCATTLATETTNPVAR
ncbi:MAG: RNA polymerase sigma factor [Solirubrobacteraceae bacterium]